MNCLQCFRYEKNVSNHNEKGITINGAQDIKMFKADDTYGIFQKLPKGTGSFIRNLC